MATLDSPREAVEKTMAASFLTLPLAWDNQPSPEGQFVRVNIVPGFTTSALTGGGDTNISIGKNGTSRHRGAATFEINITKNTGTKLANDVAEEISQLFVRTRIDEVTFKSSDLDRFGETDSHYQLLLFVFYEHDSR